MEQRRRLPPKLTGIAEAIGASESVLYDSFSESREGSAHGRTRSLLSAQEQKGGLFQLLSEAAHTLREQVRLDGSNRGTPSIRTAGSKLDEDNRDKPRGPAVSASQAAEKAIKKAEERQNCSGPVSKSAEQCRAQALFRSPPVQAGSGEQQIVHSSGPASPCSRSPTGQCPISEDIAQQTLSSQSFSYANAATAVDRVLDPRPGSAATLRSKSQNGSGTAHDHQATSDWDCVRECSEPDTIGSRCLPSTDSLPSGMVQKQGSWAHSMASSLPNVGGLQHGGSVLTDDSDVPKEVFFDFPSTSGKHPSARWAHASAASEDKLFILGGTGRGWHSDCFVLYAGRNHWVQIPQGKEAPPATYGGAACVSRNRVFLFGGKHNQKHSRRLYSLDTSTLQWKAHKDSASAPPACASLTMTAVGRHGIYVFGGGGRKLSNTVYALDPETLAWARVNTLGEIPPARQGHTAVWDESDSLIVYGGNTGDRIHGDVRLLSLSTGFWSEAACSGLAPPPRHSHSAVMLGPNLMLIWGGCGERGAVLSDAYLLNTSSFMWHKLKSIGSPPLGRYCHSCNVVGKRTLIFGGTNARQSFDSLIGISTDFGRQLSSLADSLSDIVHKSTPSEDRSELVRLQLGNHLRQRHAQDTSQVALARAEIAERLFEQERQRTSQLTAEVQQLRLMLREEEDRGKHQQAEYANWTGLLHRAKDMEMHRAKELNAQLQAAIATIRRQEGEAVVVDGYKLMYDRLVAERVALIERAVDLEYKNRCLEACVAELEAQPSQGSIGTAQSKEEDDPWAEEFDRRELLGAQERMRTKQ